VFSLGWRTTESPSRLLCRLEGLAVVGTELGYCTVRECPDLLERLRQAAPVGERGLGHPHAQSIRREAGAAAATE
jgi:hypothetical protein